MKAPTGRWNTVATGLLSFAIAVWAAEAHRTPTVVYAQTDIQSASIDGSIELTVSISVDDDLDLYSWAEEYCPDDADPYVEGVSVDLEVDQDGEILGQTGDSEEDDAYAELDASAQLGLPYEAFADAYACYYANNADESYCANNYQYLGTIEASIDVPYTDGPPSFSPNPSGGNIGSSTAVALIGINLTNSDGTLPSVTACPDPAEGVAISVSGGNVGEVDVSVQIPSSAQPNLSCINLSTDQGSDVEDFYIGYPAATNITLSSYQWQAGSTFELVITGSNFGSAPNVDIQATGVTYSAPLVQTNGSIETTVSVDSDAPSENATVTVSPNYFGSYFLCGTCNGQGDGSGQATALVSPVSYTYSLSPNRLNLSTGDTSKTITVNASQGNPLTGIAFNPTLTSNNASNCQATLSLQNGQATSTVTASSSACTSPSGVFDVTAAVNGTTTNHVTIVVPPQVLVQVLYGESNVAVASGTQTAQILMEALGNTIGNRYMDPLFSPSSSWQALITQQQFNGLSAGQSQTGGVEPELDAAADVFMQSQPISSVQGATCFFSPTSSGWAAIQNAQTANATTVPTVTYDPGCYAGNTRQFIIKDSAGFRGSSNTPYFIFVQQKQPTDPAIIEIP